MVVGLSEAAQPCTFSLARAVPFRSNGSISAEDSVYLHLSVSSPVGGKPKTQHGKGKDAKSLWLRREEGWGGRPWQHVLPGSLCPCGLGRLGLRKPRALGENFNSGVFDFFLPFSAYPLKVIIFFP